MPVLLQCMDIILNEAHCVCVHVCVCVCVHACVRVCIYVRTYMYACAEDEHDAIATDSCIRLLSLAD